MWQNLDVQASADDEERLIILTGERSYCDADNVLLIVHMNRLQHFFLIYRVDDLDARCPVIFTPGVSKLFRRQGIILSHAIRQ